MDLEATCEMDNSHKKKGTLLRALDRLNLSLISSFRYFVIRSIRQRPRPLERRLPTERQAHLGSLVRQELQRQEPVQQELQQQQELRMERLLQVQLALEEQWWSFRPFQH